MAHAGPTQLLHAWFERVWMQGDLTAIDDLMAPSGVAHGMPSGPISGPTDLKAFVHTFRTAFPDVQITVMRCIESGDYCSAYCEVTATHTGDSLGFPATGRSVRLNGSVMVRAENGLIVEGWNCWDFFSLYQQLGRIPASLAGAEAARA